MIASIDEEGTTPTTSPREWTVAGVESPPVSAEHRVQFSESQDVKNECSVEYVEARIRRMRTVCVGVALVMSTVYWLGTPNHAQSEEPSETVVTIPVGPEGIEYFGVGMPETRPYGPSAFDIGPDGSFWIMEPDAREIHRYDVDGGALPSVILAGGLQGGTYIAVDSDGIWIYEEGGNCPRLARVDLTGRLTATYPVGPETGTSGLLADASGGVVLEWSGEIAYRLTEHVGAGRVSDLDVDAPDRAATELPDIGGPTVPTWQGRPVVGLRVGSHEYNISGQHLVIDNSPVKVADALPADATLWQPDIEAVLPNGTVYLTVGYMLPENTVELLVLAYSPTGGLVAAYAVPNEDQLMQVPDPFGVAPNGDVFYLVTRPTQVEIRKLRPRSATMRTVQAMQTRGCLLPVRPSEPTRGASGILWLPGSSNSAFAQ